MSEIVTDNLDQHYSTSSKIKHEHKIVNAPNKLPSQIQCSESEMNKRFNEINADIYENTKKRKKNSKEDIKYIVMCSIATILAIFGIKQIYKMFKK